MQEGTEGKGKKEGGGTFLALLRFMRTYECFKNIDTL